MMREWGLARSRVEGEIQRKKEHINEATKFEARAWSRSNWKTKLHKVTTMSAAEQEADFLNISSSSEDEDQAHQSQSYSYRESGKKMSPSKSLNELNYFDMT